MLKVGLVGWRGMVGSVLLRRMVEEHDFTKIKTKFFSTSAVGEPVPIAAPHLLNQLLVDAYALEELSSLDCILTTQGSAYTTGVLPQLRALGWNGYWLDASSALRMNADTIILLDPINATAIMHGLCTGVKNYSGGNCTVSLMLLALQGLFQDDLVEWVSSMTYQAASGAGANHIRELLQQSGVIYSAVANLLVDKDTPILNIEQQVTAAMRQESFPCEYFLAPLAGSVIPWIDTEVANGQTKEEWKGTAETNKILGLVPEKIKVDGVCVRVGTLRCHSQALTIKLKSPNLPLAELEAKIAGANPWVNLIANTKTNTLQALTPAAVSGSLSIAVGRLKKLNFGPEYLSLFTVGDQLLWGAAEPLRRMLQILVNYHD
jgi:aspartate-semialdehyde dehydrogenase